MHVILDPRFRLFSKFGFGLRMTKDKHFVSKVNIGRILRWVSPLLLALSIQIRIFIKALFRAVEKVYEMYGAVEAD